MVSIEASENLGPDGVPRCGLAEGGAGHRPRGHVLEPPAPYRCTPALGKRLLSFSALIATAVKITVMGKADKV